MCYTKCLKVIRSNYNSIRWSLLLILIILLLNFLDPNLLEFATKNLPALLFKSKGVNTVGKEETTCQILKSQKRLLNKNITLVRVIGPTVYPLRDPSVLTKTLKHILHNEIEVRRSRDCLTSVWVVDCMYNYTSEMKNIERTLAGYEQLVFHVPNCGVKPKFAFDNVLNLNEAKSYAMKVAQTYKTDWSVFMYGNSFLPKESLQKLVRSLATSELFGTKFKAVPHFGSLNCDPKVFNNYFQLSETSVSNLLFKGIHVLDDPSSTSQQPTQIAVSNVHLNAHVAANIFSMNFKNTTGNCFIKIRSDLPYYRRVF